MSARRQEEERREGRLHMGATNRARLLRLDLNSGKPGALSDRIAAHLRDLIKKKHLVFPAALPGGRELARAWGVGYVTVQKALAECAREGLLTRHPRRGTVVSLTAGQHLASRTLFAVIHQADLPGDVDLSQTVYFSSILQGLQMEMTRQRVMVWTTTLVGAGQAQEFLRTLREHPGCAVLLFRLQDARLAQAIQRMGNPVVAVDPHARVEGIPQILQDEDRAARDLVASLLARGHRRLGLLVVDSDKWMPRRRREALISAIHQAGLSLPLARIGNLTGVMTDSQMTIMIRRVMSGSSRPTALIMTKGIRKHGVGLVESACKDRGIRLPEDVEMALYATCQECSHAPASTPILVLHDAVGFGQTIGRLVTQWPNPRTASPASLRRYVPMRVREEISMCDAGFSSSGKP